MKVRGRFSFFFFEFKLLLCSFFLFSLFLYVREGKGSARKRGYILVSEIKKEGDEKWRRAEWYTEVRDDNKKKLRRVWTRLIWV